MASLAGASGAFAVHAAVSSSFPVGPVIIHSPNTADTAVSRNGQENERYAQFVNREFIHQIEWWYNESSSRLSLRIFDLLVV